MRIIAFILLIFFSLATAQELRVDNCEEKIITNKYGKFSQKFCDVYLHGELIGMIVIEEHISPPFYGMIGGFLKIGNKIYRSDFLAGKYFAIYEPYGDGLKIETMCGISYSNSNNFWKVWKAILNCIKEVEKYGKPEGDRKWN